ncbi:hypothetical protein [Undibacterium sp. TS12]|uniref:hypothetical protein n=1 Tax=Undibacterium sp. TS12 TaxID=2908202 RepID=UPI001F4C70F1|nr:hypothetical protein [Undibacterium sp. TS12]MCH8619357.1 hypothetical protein [Undibacterium sp. TS12]
MSQPGNNSLQNPDDVICFLDSHRPGVEAGDYEIEVTQEIVGTGIPEATFSKKVSFSIQGQRFSLPPTEILAMFPPNGSMGDHANVLPHMVLQRSTLPWERKAQADSDAPWLALLVFHEGEIGDPQTMALKDTKLGYQAEKGQSLDDQVIIIEVEKSLLESLLPSINELKLLTHVRQRSSATATPLAEVATIIAKRLPKANGMSTAHLVSLENRYTGEDNTFDFKNKETTEEQKIRFISLASFRFGCTQPEQQFTSLLLNLKGSTPATGPSSLRLPESDFPWNRDEIAKAQLASGAVPMRHSLRNGKKTVSWYHGPLAPANNPLDPHSKALPSWPVKVADKLLRYNRESGMFDVSYAAAWEIGRLVALQNKKFSLELLHWKQEQAKLRQTRSCHPLAIPVSSSMTDIDVALPPSLQDWMLGLRLLEGVPFSYLVPDERMLPVESIRFFAMDWLWITCLLDGAFSVGSVTQADKERDKAYLRHRTDPQGLVTGVLLRSEVVPGWPGLQIDGYIGGNKKLKPPLRIARLAPDVLFYLFDGVLDEIKIHQKIETLHFGLRGENDALTKKPRSQENDISVIWKDKSKRIIDMTAFSTAMCSGVATIDSANFASAMIEGVEEVTFAMAQPPQ